MTYLIDRIKTNRDALRNFTDADVWTGIKQAVSIDVQNVSDYYFESQQETWSLDKDFPNVAPPMPWMWMEWRLPESMNSEGRIIPLNVRGQLGALIGAVDFKNAEQLAFLKAPSEIYDQYTERARIRDIEKLEQAGVVRWFCHALLFGHSFDSDNGVPRIIINIAWKVTNDGTIDFFENRLGEKKPFLLENVTKRQMDMVIQSEAKSLGAIGQFLNVPLLAMSFMHCKNVTVETERVPDERLQRRRIKVGRPPLTRMYTLDVKPIRRIIRETSGAEELTTNSLHICRGHFKDFRDGRGLFGRHRGLYWWPMHVKGTAAIGEVKKNYRVNTPGGGQ